MNMYLSSYFNIVICISNIIFKMKSSFSPRISFHTNHLAVYPEIYGLSCASQKSVNFILYFLLTLSFTLDPSVSVTSSSSSPSTSWIWLPLFANILCDSAAEVNFLLFLGTGPVSHSMTLLVTKPAHALACVNVLFIL